MKQILLPFICIALSLGLQSCDKTGCTDPEAINFDIEAIEDDGSCKYTAPNTYFVFNHLVDGQPLALGQEYVSPSGARYKFTNVQFYLCKFNFTGTDQSDSLPDRYLLIGNETDTVPLGNLKAGNYTSLDFMVGVDSVNNHADPSTWPSAHALSSNQERFRHWGWDTGYLFAVIEGYVDTSATGNGPLDKGFNFHIGTDKLIQQVSFTKNFTISGDHATYLALNIDYQRLFDNIDLRSEYTTHSLGSQRPLAIRFAENYQSAFAIQ